MPGKADVRDIRIELQKQGWTLRRKTRHWQAIPPDKTMPVCHVVTTPSDTRAVKNLIAQLRRSGFTWHH